MKFTFKKALVTGGAGFIGSHLVDALVDGGCRVNVLDNLASGKLSNLDQVKEYITFYKGDIQDQKILDKAINGCEVIFHEAAVVSVTKTVKQPVESAMVNEIGALNVLDGARRHGVKRVILASSSAVYGDSPELPKHESMTPKPQSPYAVQKLSNEIYADLYSTLYGLGTVCLRYFNVYGPRQDPSSPYSGVISIFLTCANEKTSCRIYGDGKQTRDFIFVKDVVQANLLAANAMAPENKVFNTGTSKTTSINHLWQLISDISGTRENPEYCEARSGDILESAANINQISSELNFKPEISFKNGLALTWKWYRNNN